MTSTHAAWRRAFTLALAMAVMTGTASRAHAQAAEPAASTDPNPGNLTVTGGIDFPSLYVFRGLIQESDPSFTVQPYADLGMVLHSGDGAVKSVGFNVGFWNSPQTGSSGSDGPSGQLWYEEDVYAAFTLGFARSTALTTTYIAYTSPNGMFSTVKEVNFKFAMANKVAPYGIVAFELGDENAAGADGTNPGTYLELGAAPSWPLAGGKATVAIPLKVGLSLSNYYELGGQDSKFGFFDIGALFTVPCGTGSKFGSWNIHGGVDVYTFGDTPKAWNNGDSSKVVGSIGIGLSY